MTGHGHPLDAALVRFGVEVSEQTRAAAIAGYSQGWRHGEAHGRDTAALEHVQELLDQDQMLEDIARRHTAQVLQYADAQRLAAGRAASPSHLQLVARRHPENDPGANALFAEAAVHHQRVWAGWPGRTPA